MAPKKNRCNFKECPSAAQRIVGDCGFCQGHFCSKHRLLEDHKCEGLEDVSNILDGTSASSPSPSSEASSSPPAPQWWLVGLGDALAGGDADMADDVWGSSARSSRTSATPRSSRASAPRSLRVFDEDYEVFDDECPAGDTGGDTIMGGT